LYSANLYAIVCIVCLLPFLVIIAKSCAGKQMLQR
jgi:hypothetical protein